jgi:gliding motility-associated-like protein
VFLISAFFSCKKTDDHKNHQTVLNVDFPAAFVANGSSNDISVINLNTNKEHSKISLNGATYPHHIYISPDKSKLAVAITSSDLSGGHGDHAGHGSSVTGLRVQILNTKTGVIEKEIALSKMPHNAIFSPNGTGPKENNTLRVFGKAVCVKDFGFVIYDRWGQKVFEATNINAEWDGFYKGRPAQEGNYVYDLNVQLYDDTILHKSGSLTLVR